MSWLPGVFSDPWVFLLLLVFPLLGMARLYAIWRNQGLLARLGLPQAVATLLPRPTRARRLAPFITATAITLIILGAAAPHWGKEEHPEVVAGRDLVVVLDMSNSMRATDAPPNRFERARAAVLDLADAVQQRGGHRLALVVFAADAQVVCPLTHDYAHFRAKARDLDLDRPPPALRAARGGRSGTRIGAGLRAAVELHDPAARGFQDILLLSDGDDPVDDGEWQGGLKRARDAEIPVATVGMGDPDRDAEVNVGGEKVRSRLHERPLREIARQTGGHYLPAHVDAPRLVEFFRQRIESKEGMVADGEVLPIRRTRQAWFYAGAMALLGLGWLIRLT